MSFHESDISENDDELDDAMSNFEDLIDAERDAILKARSKNNFGVSAPKRACHVDVRAQQGKKINLNCCQ